MGAKGAGKKGGRRSDAAAAAQGDERARADRAMAERAATCYAGAASDVSPAPEALPVPARLLATLGGAPRPFAGVSRGATMPPLPAPQPLKTQSTSPPASLEAASEELRRVLGIGRGV